MRDDTIVWVAVIVLLLLWWSSGSGGGSGVTLSLYGSGVGTGPYAPGTMLPGGTVLSSTQGGCGC